MSCYCLLLRVSVLGGANIIKDRQEPGTGGAYTIKDSNQSTGTSHRRSLYNKGPEPVTEGAYTIKNRLQSLKVDIQ